MSSHNRNRPSYQTGDYSGLLMRLEEAYDPEDLDYTTLKEYLGRGIGRTGIAQQLADISRLTKEIRTSNNINKLTEIEQKIADLPIFRDRLLSEVQEKIISLSVAQYNEFAISRKITLSDRVIAKREKWKDGKTRVVIRDRGRLKAWRRE